MGIDQILLNSIDFDSYNDIDEIYQLIKACIANATESLIPSKRVNSFSKPFWNNELQVISLQIRHARRTMRNFTTPANILL